MAEHRIEFIHSLQRNPMLPEFAQCKCGASSGWKMSRDETQEWAGSHSRAVDRVRLALSRRTPGLSDQHKWYVEQSQNMDLTAHDRTLWAMLADEIAPRLPNDTTEDQDPLF